MTSLPDARMRSALAFECASFGSTATVMGNGNDKYFSSCERFCPASSNTNTSFAPFTAAGIFGNCGDCADDCDGDTNCGEVGCTDVDCGETDCTDAGFATEPVCVVAADCDAVGAVTAVCDVPAAVPRCVVDCGMLVALRCVCVATFCACTADCDAAGAVAMTCDCEVAGRAVACACAMLDAPCGCVADCDCNSFADDCVCDDTAGCVLACAFRVDAAGGCSKSCCSTAMLRGFLRALTISRIKHAATITTQMSAVCICESTIFLRFAARCFFVGAIFGSVRDDFARVFFCVRRVVVAMQQVYHILKKRKPSQSLSLYDGFDVVLSPMYYVGSVMLSALFHFHQKCATLSLYG